MSTRKPGARRRIFQPGAEGLEDRKLLTSLSTQPTARVSGTDIDGDRWSLTLLGPGTLNVSDSNGYAFTGTNKYTPNLINTITIGGAISSETRLVGRVTRAGGGDGQVYFQNLNVTPTGLFPKLDPNETENNRTVQNGIAAIDMPQFYLGHTDGTTPSASSTLHSGFRSAGQISIPGGINTLRFGGVDVNYFAPGSGSLNSDGQNDEFVVDLGLPVAYGTSIIVKKVVTNAQAAATSSGSPTQNSVSFVTTGRLNLFQANEIQGNATPGLVPTQFLSASQVTNNMPGGTYVISQGGTVTGAIGAVKVGGNATNFTVFATAGDLSTTPIESATDPKISNFYIGQESNNVVLIAPGGSRDVYFGRGMDNVHINSRLISNLAANRGAVGSSVTVTRSIANAVFGGDLVNTNIQAGYDQSLATIAHVPAGTFTSGSGVFYGEPVPTIADRVVNSAGTLNPLAHSAGTIKIRVAGNVTNSVISASVDPDPSGLLEPGAFSNVTTRYFPFGTPENLVLPRGKITAKVEGNVDNANNPLVSINAPADKAFFAKSVKYQHGPVTPPNVVEPPFGPTKYYTGQRFLTGLIAKDHALRQVQHPQHTHHKKN